MTLQWVNLLRARRTDLQDEMIGHGEGDSRCRNRNHELPSGCHQPLLLANFH
jgi:hypothetical protein